MSRPALAIAIQRSAVTLEKYEAEAPPELIAALSLYAQKIGRADAIPLLTPELAGGHQNHKRNPAEKGAKKEDLDGQLSEVMGDSYPENADTGRSSLSDHDLELQNLLPHERKAITLLLQILRRGTETKQQAIVSNLKAFTEGDHERGPEANTVPEQLLDDLVKASEAIITDEKMHGEWLACLGAIKAQFSDTRNQPEPAGNVRGKRANANRSGPRRRGGS